MKWLNCTQLLTSEFYIIRWELLSAPHTFFPTELMEKGYNFLGITTMD